ncbi:enhancer of Polycomb isoform X2 [Brevipalpus obovatus]|uniref:enhancer of Polycomb isoform X2 n=1 Tax=Brevipalpus obovatus TaxID=246614 RepID=UPI003D9DC54C
MRGRDLCTDIKMSKLSFRARQPDHNKMMPVFRFEEIPDLPDLKAINRSVPPLPTGMEKEEESEHHLQRAISAQQAFGHTGELVIPTPEVYKAPEDYYNELYPCCFKLPKQLIRVQPFAIEEDVPDYDMDSEDEAWLDQQREFMHELTQLKFEEMMDKLEKCSGQHVVTINEAKLLLKEKEDLIITVYDYWLNKRLRTQQSLTPTVKTERRDGNASNNPYIAFRRRTEKMRTRKNRENDEVSYEKMLKLRRDLSRAVDLLQCVKEREKLKHQQLQLTIEIFKKRFEIGDFNGQVLAEISALRHIKPTPAYLPINNIGMMKSGEKMRSKIDETLQPPRRKREYRRRHKQSATNLQKTESTESNDYLYSSDDEILNGSQSQPASDQEEDDPDGAYAFKRQKGCSYHAPLIEQTGNWPWCHPEEGGLGDKRYRYCLTSVNIGAKQKCIGFVRRRYGRGGRIIFDRAYTPMDDRWKELDPDFVGNEEDEFIQEVKKEWIHYRPKSPPKVYLDEERTSETQPVYDEFGNLIPVVELTPEEELEDGEESFSLASASAPTEAPTTEPVDRESFINHQKELFEMQRKQLERLKEQESSDITVNSNNLNLCNVSSEHSLSSSIMDQASSSISSSPSETTISSLPQPSRLDTVRLQSLNSPEVTSYCIVVM